MEYLDEAEGISDSCRMSRQTVGNYLTYDVPYEALLFNTDYQRLRLAPERIRLPLVHLHVTAIRSFRVPPPQLLPLRLVSMIGI